MPAFIGIAREKTADWRCASGDNLHALSALLSRKMNRMGLY
jgi:hypothetical protein